METAGDACAAGGPADYARACIARLVCGRRLPAPPEHRSFATRAACFVSLKKHGELRGCIGTLEPAEPHLAAEIARNARSAAFHDPRFHRLREHEVEDLTCSVDVLSPSEPCTLGDLAPERYGVIVVCGYRRGVLLPDLEGVNTVGQQVGIALQKAGIAADEPFAVARFTVQRFREGDTCEEGSCVGERAHHAEGDAEAPPVLALFGATALGKTRVAVALAERLGAEIVVADSMQVYRGLAIVTNQPDADRRSQVRHHLVGFRAPQEEFTVAQYAREAHAVIDALRAEGRAVIVEGGSGLDPRAALGDLEFAAAPGESLRRELEGRWASDPRGVVDELRALDPAALAALDAANPRRVIRALEAVRVGGRPLPVAAGNRLWRPAERYPHRLLALLPGRRPPCSQRAHRGAR